MSGIQRRQGGQEGRDTKRSGRGPLTDAPTVGLWGLALISVVVALYVIAHLFIKPGGDGGLKSLAKGEMAALETAQAGAPEPTTGFIDADGRPAHLADLKGRVLVVNLWATWCGPCVQEMPTLARLQAAYPGRILVAPISMDAAGDREKARAFIADHPPLAFYQDEHSALAFALSPPAEGFPTTVIYDAAGHEQARLGGGANWDSPAAHAVIDALLKHG